MQGKRTERGNGGDGTERAEAERNFRGEREKVIERPGVVGGERWRGEGENLQAFYVSNYMKDGITHPTDRPADPFLPSFRSESTNQPTRDLLFQSSA